MQTSQQINKTKFFYRATRQQRLIAGVVFLVITAIFALLALIGQYKVDLWPFGCGFQQSYNLPCPTCGMTTSAIAFTQGRIFESFYIQPACALFCSILLFSAFWALLTSVFGIYSRFLKSFFTEVKIKHLVLAIIIVAAAGWAVTMARALAAQH